MFTVKNNYVIAFIAGVLSVAVWIFSLKRLGLPDFLILAFSIIFPFGCILAIFISNLLPKFKNLFGKLVKYALTGFLNTGIDLAIFNFLLYVFKIEVGYEILFFKTISFSVAVVNSYLWNRFWVFGDTEVLRVPQDDLRRTAQVEGLKFAKFITVTIGGFILNVSITTLLVNFVPPLFGLSQLRWDNVAAIVATAFNLTWNFIGYYLVVFASKFRRADNKV